LVVVGDPETVAEGLDVEDHVTMLGFVGAVGSHSLPQDTQSTAGTGMIRSSGSPVRRREMRLMRMTSWKNSDPHSQRMAVLSLARLTLIFGTSVGFGWFI
jgi:hypothetical protein